MFTMILITYEVVNKLTQDLKEMRIKYKDSKELDKSFI